MARWITFLMLSRSASFFTPKMAYRSFLGGPKVSPSSSSSEDMAPRPGMPRSSKSIALESLSLSDLLDVEQIVFVLSPKQILARIVRLLELCEEDFDR